MNKISAIIKSLFVLLVVSSLTFAQYDTKTDSQDNKNSNTNQGTQNDQDNDKNILGQNDDPFRPTAMTLAQDLQSRLTLTNDQVDEITDILVDYKNDIADIKHDKSDEMREDNTSPDHGAGTTTGTGTTKTESDKTDRTGVAHTDSTANKTGINDDNEMLGGKTDFAEKFRDADVSANEDIEGVLEKEQMARYIQIKRDWWDTVKERVHSEASKENQNKDNDDNDGLLDNNNNNNDKK